MNKLSWLLAGIAQEAAAPAFIPASPGAGAWQGGCTGTAMPPGS